VKRRSWIEEIARDMCREVYEATNAQPDAWCDIDDEVSMRVLVAYAAVRKWLIVDWSKDRVRLTDEDGNTAAKSLDWLFCFLPEVSHTIVVKVEGSAHGVLQTVSDD